MSEETITPEATVTGASATPVEALKSGSAAVVQPVPEGLKQPQPKTPEPKADSAEGDKAGDDGNIADNKAKTDNSPTPNPGAPENYEFQVPEGYEKLDEKIVEAFVPIAKELNLSQEAAQRLVNLQAELKNQEANAQKAITDGWLEATKLELGSNAEQSLASMNKVRIRLADPEFNEILEATKLGNHPAVVRTFIKLGKMISEDVAPEPQNQPSRETGASVMYHSTNKQ
jgi:hypothetical protein